MRFDEVVIERYGAIASRRIGLDGPGLTVVYGPNEAGKSTCLAAVTDFLFRIPEGTTRIGRFGADAARVGARLRTTDGRVLQLTRRYGRVRTLIDDNGTACDEGLLASLLGSTTRDRFETLFGLGHEALRRGGDSLLRADGDIGRLIVEAGGGLRVLMSRLDAIDAEIDTLFSMRRAANRTFYKALGDYEAAEKTIRSGTLTREGYERDCKAHQAASTALADARAVRRELSERLSRLQRIERTIPVLLELQAVEDQIAGFADVAALDRELPQRAAAAYAAAGAARRELDKARMLRHELAERVRALDPDETLVGIEAAVRDLEGRAATVAAARDSRANRAKELSDAESALAVLRHRLNVGPEIDLESRMPTAEAIDAVRTLAAQALSRHNTLQVTRDAEAEAAEAVRAAQARLAELVARGRAQPFGTAATEFVSLPAEAAAADQKSSKASSSENAARRCVAALGFDDPADLRALPFPPDDLVRSELEQRNAVDAERTRQVAAKAAAETQRDAGRAETARLQAEGQPATPEVLAEARRRRDEAWQQIRTAYADPDLEPSWPVRQSQVSLFEAGLVEADRVADARVTEAERVAALIEAGRRIGEAEAAIGATIVAEQRLLAGLEDRASAFSRAYPEASRLVPEVASLLAFSSSRAEALAAVTSAREARADADQALRTLAPRLRLLALAEGKAGLAPPVDADLVARVHALMVAIAAHDREHAEHGREASAVASFEAKLSAARRKLAGLEAEEGAWAHAWSAATSALAVPATTAAAVADELAVRWDAARGDFRAIAQTRRRLARMDEDEADLQARVRGVGALVGFSLPEDPVAATAMLGERWRANDANRLRRDALAPDLEAATASVADSERAAQVAEEALRTLRSEIGPDLDDPAVRTAAARRHDLSACQEGRSRLVQAARTAGDGLDSATLLAQADGYHLDAIRAEIGEVKARLEALDGDIDAAIRAEQQAGSVLAAHEGPSGIGVATVEREAAIVGMHTAVERYVELTLARRLLDRAIQQVRGEQQDPLVREAGRMFARMTGGEFDGVAADVDAKGSPVVVGVRSGGRGSQHVATMSEGTRDQLFLAFRLASLANYCAAAESLPFVADDILVHFDDDRGEATLDLLADFAEGTQVLLFTHHRSVLASAERLAAAGRASIADF